MFWSLVGDALLVRINVRQTGLDFKPRLVPRVKETLNRGTAYPNGSTDITALRLVLLLVPVSKKSGASGGPIAAATTDKARHDLEAVDGSTTKRRNSNTARSQVNVIKGAES